VVIAPLWRRCAASVLELTAVLGGATAVVGAVVVSIHVLTESSEYAEKLFDRWDSQSREAREERGSRRHAVRPEAIAAGMVMAVQARNRQPVAQRLMGIRRVDARTGGGVRINSAIVHYLVWQSSICRSTTPLIV
jgi:hypothetical protein